jgi:hypothetical protein
VVDILGNVLHVQVHAANVPDTRAGCAVLQRTAEKYPSLEAFCGDAGYRGTAVSFVEQTLGLTFRRSQPRAVRRRSPKLEPRPRIYCKLRFPNDSPRLRSLETRRKAAPAVECLTIDLGSTNAQ